MKNVIFIILFVAVSGLIIPNAFAEDIPEWVKNNAGWWAADRISEDEFVNAMRFLINEKIIIASHTVGPNESGSQKVPDWVKNNAGWWADNQIPDSAFIDGIEFLIKDGIIKIKIESSKLQILLSQRDELIDFIWKGEGLPTRLPDFVEYKINDKNFDEMKNLEKIDRITIKMKNGINSIAYLMHPTQQLRDDLIIYHNGHGDYLHDGKKQINFFLDRGYTVLVFSMPVSGNNNEPTVMINGKEKEILTHEDIAVLDSDEFSGISYFVEPITVSLNFIEKNFDYANYHMIGISGGGWTAVIFPAIDDRISHSFSVAGSIPLEQRTDMRDKGDYEQTNTELYQIANYYDLYTLASLGEDRKLTQVFMKYDICCFSSERIDFSYKNRIKDNLVDLDGKFDILEKIEWRHNISGWTLIDFFSDIDVKNRSYVLDVEARIGTNDYSSMIVNGEGIDLVKMFGQQATENKDLSGIDFTASYIINLDLSDFDLRNTNFYSTQIEVSDFSGSDLTNSDLSYSMITKVDFEKATMHNVDFKYSTMKGVDFTKASLKNIRMDLANCFYCNFNGIDITEIKISSGEGNTNFAGSTFRNVDFRNWEHGAVDFGVKGSAGENYPPADLTGSNFSGVDLKNITFFRGLLPDGLDEGIILDDADFSFADLSSNKLVFASLRNTNLVNANLAGTQIHYTNFEGANLEGANFQGADFEGANFEGANLKNANFKEVELEAVAYRPVYPDLGFRALENNDDLHDLLAFPEQKSFQVIRSTAIGEDLQLDFVNFNNFTNANLAGANFEGAELSLVDFTNANLAGANLRGANLECANLEGANLEGADLEGATFEGKLKLHWKQNLFDDRFCN